MSFRLILKKSKVLLGYKPFSLFACWFQSGLISQPTVFFSHNKPAPAGLISPKTNQQTGRLNPRA